MRRNLMTSTVVDKKGAFWLFLIGVFSMTQVRLGARIGISEACCCLVAPLVYLKHYTTYRRDGVSVFFNLLLLWVIGAIVSDLYNHCCFEQFIRGFSVPFTLFGVSTCVYHLLRRRPDNLKFILMGIAVSSVISIFVFQRGDAGDMASAGDVQGAIDRVVGYKLFWSNQVKTWGTLPAAGWYLSIPKSVLFFTLTLVAFANMSAGGRSAFAVSILSLAIVLIGGKTAASIRSLKRYFPLLMIGFAVLVGVLKVGYSYAAKNGYLSEAETEKYEKQTARGEDLMTLIKSGRGDFFIGLDAALDKPIFGHGSQALDYFGYERDFITKYGTDFERESYIKRELNGYLHAIKAHSHVICYWMWHGILALIFWLYILYLLVTTFRKRMHYRPEWFGYLAIAIPAFLWDYFFSPLGLRVDECVLYCVMLVLLQMEKRLKVR